MRNTYFQQCDYSSRFRILKGGKISLIIGAIFSTITLSFANPSGGVVTAGSASIAYNGSTTNITQSSQKAAINWQKFSIGSSETVNFKQPNVKSITLNRVVGNERSVIKGALNANGQVFILNSNGVLFSKNASINTAGLIATTMNLSDADFMKGDYHFSGDSSAFIINQGTINISDKGYAALFGKEVSNEGIIKATLGKVKLVGAKKVTLNLNGNSLVNLTVNKGILDALVKNKGAIYANGGEVYLTTNAVDELLRGVVNNTGVIEANSLNDIIGKVELYAHGGEAKVDGTIKAKEGFVETSGAVVDLKENLLIKATGGEWLIDPYDYTIDATAAGHISTALNGGTSVTVETTANVANYGSHGSDANYGDITIASNISKTAGGDATLTLKAHRDIVMNSGTKIESSSNKLNTIFWSDSDSSNGGSIWLKATTLTNGATINTNGGDLILSGGADTSSGFATGSSNMSNGILIDSATLLTNGGDITIRGKGATGAGTGVSTSGGWIGNTDGIRLMGSSTIDSGTGSISIIGQAQGSSASNGIETNQNGITKITSAKTSGTAIHLNGDASLGGDGGNGWGTFLWGGAYGTNFGIVISATGGGDVLVEGQGRNHASATGAAGVHLEPNAYVLASSGTITLKGNGGTYNASSWADIDISGTVGYTSSLAVGFGASPVTSSSSNIVIQADKVISGAIFGGGALASSSVQSSGTLSIVPYTNGNKLYVTTVNPNDGGTSWINPNSIFEASGLFKTGFSKLIFGSSTTGDVKLDDYSFNDDTEIITSGNVILEDIAIGDNKILTVDTSAGVGTITDSGNIDVDNLKINGSNSVVTLDSTGNTISTIAANIASISLLNSNAISIGSVGGTNGITATGTIDLATKNENITINGDIATSDTTANAIKINSGKDTASGTSSGGNIIYTSGTISTGTNGRVTLYSGDIEDSTGLTNLVGSGSGKFRYNSDETSTNYTTALGSGIYAIYREQPTLSITPSSTSSNTYGSAVNISGVTGTISGYVNGDNATNAGINGTATFSTTATDSSNAGTYNIAYNNGLSNGIGYAISDNTSSTNEYTINKKDVTVTYSATNKTYDGNTNIAVSESTSDIVSTDTVTISEIAALDNKNAGTGKTVNISSIALGGVDASNYNLTSTTATTTADVAKKDLTVSYSATNKTYDGNTNVAVSESTSDIVSADTVTISEIAALDNKNAGTGKTVNISSIALGGVDASNYNLTSTTATTTADVAKKDLTVTANSDTVTYNGQEQSVSGFTATGLVEGETIAVLDNVTGYSASGTNVGVYNTSLAGTDENYNLVFVDGALTIVAIQSKPEQKITNVITPILNGTVTDINRPKFIKPEVNIPAKVQTQTLAKNIGLGNNAKIVSTTTGEEPNQIISLGKLQQANGAGDEVRVPLRKNYSIIELINGGVHLPIGVEQHFFVVSDNKSEN
jgi:filamentous hemagglutinin family protein